MTGLRTLVFIIAMSGAIPAFAQTDACTMIAAGANQDITAFGDPCKKVTNGASDTVCAVSNADLAQWQSFYTNPPGGVTIGACSGGASNLYCWGSGPVGDGSSLPAYVPIALPLPSGVTSYTATSGNCAIGNNGRAYCWGWYGGWGQMGDGTNNAYLSPSSPVSLPSGVTSFTAISSTYDRTCAIGNNGNLYCWGRTVLNGIVNTPTLVPLPGGVTSYTSVSAGFTGTDCAIGNNGRVYCWGGNGSGEIGDGTTTTRTTPTAATLPSGVTSFTNLAVGTQHACAIGNNGRAYCWGYNALGFIGDGTTTNRLVPTLVNLPSGVTSYTRMAAGYHSCGIGNNGRAYCWGYNAGGQLGDGTTTNRTVPTLVTLPGGVTSFTDIVAADFTTCAIGNNARAYCWGQGNSGQIGDGAVVMRLTPTAVSNNTATTSLGKVYNNCGIGTFAAASCYGYSYGGYCYYKSTDACDTACGGRNGCNAAGVLATGSGGTDAACQSVGATLIGSTWGGNTTGAQGCVAWEVPQYECDPWNPWDCWVVGTLSYYGRATSPATSCSAAAGYERLCACNK